MTSGTAIAAAASHALKGAPMSFHFMANALRRLKIGRVLVDLPNGATLTFEGVEPGPEGRMTITRWSFGKRLIAGGAVGFAEGYMDGDWDTPDLSALLRVMSLNFDAVEPSLKGNVLSRLAHRLYHALRRNSRRGSRKNIHEHYDLGNEFYRLWLDPTMTYSAARFDPPEQSLEDAQRAKYASLANLMELKEGEHVLEIGAGWGGFAEYAAKERGARVTGITISKEQFDFARKRMFEGQLADKVDIKLVDYRDVEGAYDRVASIEMFEAVGERYWPAYFDKIRSVLKPGGSAGLQIITIRDDLFEHYRRSVDFIQRYVFPGGMLPSVERLRDEAGRAGLAWRDALTFGGDYARTLKEWAERFHIAWDDITAMSDKFDERFRRLWLFYLAYCEAGFGTGRIDVAQINLSPR
jgi:cyclopropane-fatty-acyl-phospholipid synthase